MYRVGKHNAADVSSKWPDYASEVEEDSCLPMLQSKLRAMRTVTSESLKPSRGKPNEADCAKHVSGVSVLVGHKSIIREEFEMNWHKLPESPMRELNEADHTECVGSMTALVGCKLAI